MNPILLIDFGSTNTKVTAVDLDEEQLLGTAASDTTVKTDIGEGLEKAMAILEEQTGHLTYTARYGCSSAAGGLKMIASGLVPELTAEAARQAALGAGAKVMKVYSYELTEEDIEEIGQMKPDIFLLTGGTDGGNKDNILQNARMLAEMEETFPILIAGNRTVRRKCQKILEEAGKTASICENVMPRLGELNVEPAQTQIRELFLRQIIKAKGLSKASELISGIMMPTPGAVLKAMELLSKGTAHTKGLGDLVAIDVGGATTDVYSMSQGTPERANTVLKGLPEPFAKRTVEGDIGMRYSALGIVEAVGRESLCSLAELSESELMRLLKEITENPDRRPTTEELKRLDFALAAMAVKVGMTRHAGKVELTYTPMGETFVQAGKDLRQVERMVITGGSLIHTDKVRQIASYGLYNPAEPEGLKPRQVEVLVDKAYILSAMGLLGEYEPDIALNIMKKELISHGTAK
ncbi:MAG: MutL protein [Firmicutes bacterium]|nr:MutL protein [Bacillota bacterium]